MNHEEKKNEIVIYQPDETIRLEVRLENDTVWLTQTQLCNLFGIVKPNISSHLKNIFETNELDYSATVQKIEQFNKSLDVLSLAILNIIIWM